MQHHQLCNQAGSSNVLVVCTFDPRRAIASQIRSSLCLSPGEKMRADVRQTQFFVVDMRHCATCLCMTNEADNLMR